MTLTQQKLLLYNNLEFIFMDMSEMCRSQKNDLSKRLGLIDKKDVSKLASNFSECKKTWKRLFAPYKTLVFAMSDYKAIIRESEDETQIQLGEDSDMLLELILTAIDRAGDDNSEMQNIIDQIKLMPSKLNIV